MNDYYSVLGVAKTATAEEIKTAYRKLARQWHPDKNASPEATSRFQEVNEAYQTLSDPQKKRAYDTPQAKYTSQDFGDIFNRQPYSQQTFTIQQLSLTLEEAYNGGTKVVSGAKVKFAAGVRNGTMFQDSGTLYSIRIIPHNKFFVVNHNDLATKLEITTLDAIVGMSVTMTHIDGKKLEFEVPPGVQHDQVIRLIGKGMPVPEQGDKFGHLFIICSLRTPTDLTHDQKVAILQIHPKRTQEI